MADRSDCYKYTNKMIEAPTRDESRYVKHVNQEELDMIKKENEDLKSKVAELMEIVHRIEQNTASKETKKK